MDCIGDVKKEKKNDKFDKQWKKEKEKKID